MNTPFDLFRLTIAAVFLGLPFTSAAEGDLPPDGKVTATIVGSLPAKLHMPVVYSYDGKSLLYFTEPETHRFEYWRADADGSKRRRVYQTDIDWDDYLNALTGPSFADEGGRIAVATAQSDKAHGADRKKVRLGVIDKEGQLTKIDSELGEIMGFGFARNKLLFLDSTSSRDSEGKGKGYRLKEFEGKKQHTLLQSEEGFAAVLHVSPTNRHAAFFEFNPAEGKYRLRVIDLKTRNPSESDWFFSGDYTFDGGPAFYWDAKGLGIFYHQSKGGWSKLPFSLMRFDLETIKSTEVKTPENTAVVAVLDENHLAVKRTLTITGGGVLRLSDGKSFVLPGQNSVLGGHGRYLAYANFETLKVHIARIELIE